MRFEKRVWLSLDMVHLLHCLLTFTLAAHDCLADPTTAWKLGSRLSQDPEAEHALLPNLLICTVAGFLGFQLFVMVHQR